MFKKHFFIALIVLTSLFLLFYQHYEHTFVEKKIKKLKGEAAVVEHYIWEFDKNGALKYLSLASDYGKYEQVRVVDINGNVFIDQKFYQPSSAEVFFKKINLASSNIVKINIIDDGTQLGVLEVVYFKDTIWMYIYAFILNLFLLIIYLFFIYLIKVKKSLEITVYNRTLELANREKMLIETNDKLFVTINSIGDIFISTDIEGAIDYINPIGEGILKYKFLELKGKRFQDVFGYSLSKNDQVQEYSLDQVLKDGLSISHEEPILVENKQGEIIYVLDKATPIYNAKKDIIGSVIILKDITKTYELLEELRQSQKMESIGQLSGGIAHDFNNMLSGILGATELLLLEEQLPSVYKENLDIILKSSQKASQLTRKLLDFSRKGGIYKEVLDINKEIIDTLALLKRSIDKKIKIKTSFHAKEHFVEIDSSQFQNAIINLVVNSKDAVDEKPRIEVKTENFYASARFCEKSLFNIYEGNYIKISIKDNGKGMTEEVKEKIFEPFFTTKDVGKGTGLGLSAVYGTIIDYKGFLEVDSSPEKGTSIALYFPVAKGIQKAQEKQAKASDSKKQKGNILLVDDEEGVRNISAKMLRKLGFQVFEATNGKEAIQLYSEMKELISLVVMDIVMPEMDGREAFYALKEMNPDVKVILLSGFTRETSVNLLIKEGVKGFLLKPYTIQSLKEKINAVL